MTENRTEHHDPALPEARRRRTRWPGWVWLIPLVALGFAGWLIFEEWVVGPRPLTVYFDDVAGIKPGAPVRYRGVQVGSVDQIKLNDDLAGATLVLDMTGLKGRLGEGTRIWIARPNLSPNDLGQLLSGAYLAIEPGAEGEVAEVTGLESAPVLPPEGPGRIFVLHADETGGLSKGASVRYRGIEVGQVLGTRLGEGGVVEIPVFIHGDRAALVHEATVFWRAGGLAIDKGEGGIDIGLPSLGAVVTGAVAFDTPEVLAGAEAEEGAGFALWDSREDAATATTGPRIAYRIVFPQPVGDLAEGAAVTLAGKLVGRVAGTGLEVAPDGHGLITPVTIAIDARRMGMELAGVENRDALREQLNAILDRLAGAGMRAEVEEGGIVFGGKSIALVIDPQAGPAKLDLSGEVPAIPAATAAPAASGGGQGAGPVGGQQDGGQQTGQDGGQQGAAPSAQQGGGAAAGEEQAPQQPAAEPAQAAQQ